MNYPTTLTFNGVTTELPEILCCELVTSLYEDLGTVDIVLTNDQISKKSVESFFLFVSVRSTVNRNNMYKLLSVWNYLGCSESLLVSLRECYNSCTNTYQSFLFWKQYPSSGKDIQAPTNLRAEDYNMLKDMGYSDEQLIPYLWSGVVVDYEPGEYFLEQFSIASELVAILARPEFKNTCFIAGGFLTSCLPSTPDVLPHQDIDIFCMKGAHNFLLQTLMEYYDCKCFTAVNVTTVLVRNSVRPIQVIACSETMYHESTCGFSSALTPSTCDQILYDFDMPWCKIAYHDGKFKAMADFHQVLINNKSFAFSLKGKISRTRVAKYRSRGFKIDDSEANLYGLDNSLISDNKYYKWTDESDARLLYLVKMLFSDSYEHTKLPIPTPSDDWKKAYEGMKTVKDNRLKVSQCTTGDGATIVTLHPRNHIEYCLYNVRGIVAERNAYHEDNKLVFKLTDNEQLIKIANSLLAHKLFTNANIVEALGDRVHKRAQLEVKVARKYVKPSYILFTKHAWVKMLDGKYHTCNMAVVPKFYYNNQQVNIVFECMQISIV